MPNQNGFAWAGFESFAVACDRTRTPAAAGRCLILACRRLGFDRVALVSHGASHQVRSLHVSAHNWTSAALTHFLPNGSPISNPVLAALEQTRRPLLWSEPDFIARLTPSAKTWLEHMRALGIETAVTARIESALIGASCTLAPAPLLKSAAFECGLRAAAYTFHHILALQRPRAQGADRLTQREQQCLALATFDGLRPREVARVLGVSVNTVRSIRQSAAARLGARSQEEAAWRMLETRQAFRPAPLGRSWS